MQNMLLAERPAHVPAENVVDFDMYAPPGVADGFHAAWLKLQEPGVPDMVWTPRNEGHWIATRGDLIATVFDDHARFSSATIMIPKSLGQHHQLIPTTIDPPQHRPYRMLLSQSLSPRAIGAVETEIRGIAAGLIEAFRSQGHCDVIADYAERLPIEVFLKIVDLPSTDAAIMKQWTDATTRPDGTMSFEDAIGAFFDYLKPVIAERRGSDREDMLSRMINGRIEGRELSEREALQLCAQILIAGLDTVVNFLGFVLLHLTESPSHRAELIADPSLIPAAVDELFRRYPIVSIGRTVRQDINFGGVELKAGEMVLCATALHGLDERFNERPLAVDYRRPKSDHSTFGQGHHKCPGAHLARTEVRITIEEWLKRIPDFRLAEGAEVRMSGGIVGCLKSLPLVWEPA